MNLLTGSSRGTTACSPPETKSPPPPTQIELNDNGSNSPRFFNPIDDRLEELADGVSLQIDQRTPTDRRGSLSSQRSARGGSHTLSTEANQSQGRRPRERRGSGQSTQGSLGLPLALESPHAAAGFRAPVFPLRKGPVFPVVKQAARESAVGPEPGTERTLVKSHSLPPPPSDDLQLEPNGSNIRRVPSSSSITSQDTTYSDALSFMPSALDSVPSTAGSDPKSSASSTHSGSAGRASTYAPSLVSIPASTSTRVSAGRGMVAAGPQSIFANPEHQRRPLTDLLSTKSSKSGIEAGRTGTSTGTGNANVKKRLGFFSRSKSAPAAPGDDSGASGRGGSAAVLNAALFSAQGWPGASSPISSGPTYAQSRRTSGHSTNSSSLYQGTHGGSGYNASSTSLQSAIARAQANLARDGSPPATPMVSPRSQRSVSGTSTFPLVKAAGQRNESAPSLCGVAASSSAPPTPGTASQEVTPTT